MRILVVEDNVELAQWLQRNLRQQQYAVDWLDNGADADFALRSEKYDLVILDLALPRMNGREVLQRLRARQNATPVLVLTARDAVPDRVRGLDLGADDYVAKPVDLHELAARLRSLVRRAHGQVQDILRCGAVQLDPSARLVKLDGESVMLSTREFDLLHALMLNAGRVMSREQLEQQLYSWGYEVESNAIEVHIHHLRRKLRADIIQTVRGVGYTLLRTPELA